MHEHIGGVGVNDFLTSPLDALFGSSAATGVVAEPHAAALAMSMQQAQMLRSTSQLYPGDMIQITSPSQAAHTTATKRETTKKEAKKSVTTPRKRLDVVTVPVPKCMEEFLPQVPGQSQHLASPSTGYGMASPTAPATGISLAAELNNTTVGKVRTELTGDALQAHKYSGSLLHSKEAHGMSKSDLVPPTSILFMDSRILDARPLTPAAEPVGVSDFDAEFDSTTTAAMRRQHARTRGGDAEQQPPSPQSQHTLTDTEQHHHQALISARPGPNAGRNRRGPRSVTSRYRGVTCYKRTGRWEAHIWDGGKQVHLGSFLEDKEAARAYDRAALLLRGVDADINFDFSEYTGDPALRYMRKYAELSEEILSKEDVVFHLRLFQKESAKRLQQQERATTALPFPRDEEKQRKHRIREKQRRDEETLQVNVIDTPTEASA